MRKVIMTKLLSLLAVIALFAGCASPLPGNVSRMAAPLQQTKVTGEDALARDLMKADVWEAKREDRQKNSPTPTGYSLDGPFSYFFSTQVDPRIEDYSDEPSASDFDNDLPVLRFKVSTALMQKLVTSKKSIVKMELSETYLTAPTTQSALVNAIEQPVKLVLK